jgi:hypothetical protein
MTEEQRIVGHTKHGELTLDQIAELQPGLNQLMLQVSDRYWILYYAAQGGNWALADYQLRSLQSLWKKMITTRPKYKGMLDDYGKKILAPLDQHIKSQDFATFDKVYREGIVYANKFHVASDHGEIVWKLPPNPPVHLDLGPRK